MAKYLQHLDTTLASLQLVLCESRGQPLSLSRCLGPRCMCYFSIYAGAIPNAQEINTGAIVNHCCQHCGQWLFGCVTT
jgi:hypothetical protein